MRSLAGHGLPTHHVAGAITAFEHVADPSLAWKVPVGPAWLYWSVDGGGARRGRSRRDLRCAVPEGRCANEGRRPDAGAGPR